MLEGAFYNNVMQHSQFVPPPAPQETAGDKSGTQSFYKYGLRESSYPTLILVEEIADANGNTITPGHYELALSDDRDFLILIQSKCAIAIIPVFKIEIDTTTYSQTKTNKDLRKQKKEEKEIAKTNAKRAKVGMPPINDEQDIYQEATIEYIPDGKYYLIRYERADVKAWGAIKDSQP